MGPLLPKPILGKSGSEEIGTFNLFSSPFLDVGELSDREWLFRCSKGDASFGLTMVVVIKQPINNYNRCRVDLNLTSTSVETSTLPLKVLLCPPRC
ncbi:hypothetical protein J1N35_029125 [Gossypium stocksii]|uniref:Uncharacterized protein n=1 Tax=Gossypium stocksii TaxID=47602 RepID=A0A9D3UXK3_9ROSI|nr:hypothetical protein J1N35_029125 [Gossypium stocksii]